MRGAELSRRFWLDVVQPSLAVELPHVGLAAGHIGPGSDVQGWDDEVSRDHDWGPRLTLLLDDDADTPAVDALLQALPVTFLGVPARFSTDARDGVDRPDPDGDHHGHHVTNVDSWLARRLGPARPPLDDLDWLAVPEQSLLELTAGEVWRDDSGELSAARRALAYYPESVWLARLAAGWWHLSIEASYVGRAGGRGDTIGWRILTARQVDRLAQIAFLLARRYRPYRKWLGTALAELPAPGPDVAPTLLAALEAPSPIAALDALGHAEKVLARHQAASLPGTGQLDHPPYRPDLWRHDLPAMAAAIAALVPGRLRKRLRWPIGGVDQWQDWPANDGEAFLAARNYLEATGEA
jgi:Domain of unknown function (DUF4037)